MNKDKNKKIVLITLLQALFTSLLCSHLNAADDGISNKLTFSDKGYIYQVEEDALVIDDMTYKIGHDTKLLDQTGQETSLSNFQAGDFVGYILDSGENIIAVKKMVSQEEGPSMAPEENSQMGNGKIYQKDGVWRNQ